MPFKDNLILSLGLYYDNLKILKNLRNENTKLQAEIQNLETRNRTLEEQFEKIQAELNVQKMSHKIVMIDKSDVK